MEKRSYSGLRTTGKPHARLAGGKRYTSPSGSAAEKTVTKPSGQTGSIQIADRAGAIVAALGSKSKLASMLEVSPSQPTRWMDGTERPNSENARVIVDLDHVIARAGLLWQAPVIDSWLRGSNAFLEGARPIDVLKTMGSTPVIEALDQELAGGYA